VKTLIRISRPLAVLLAVVLLAAGCTFGPTETRDDSFAVGESVRLVVNSENGSIEVKTGSDNEVRVQATLRGANRIEYEAKQDGDTITVSARRTRWVLFARGPVTDLIIAVPTRADVNLETSNGSIELDGVEGSGSLRTSNGKIVLKDVKGNFDGDTSNGSITIEAMEGSARFQTSNGRVDLREVIGEVDVETSNGRISFSGEMTTGGRNRLITSNGAVNVELRGTPSVSLDASTSNGDVICGLPILITVMKEKELTGTIGAGEAHLYIRTSNGDVSIREGAAPQQPAIPEPTPTPAGNVYEDPAGLFTMPLIGDWTPVDTDGTYAKYAYSDMDLAMSLVTIEANDAEGDLPAAVESVGIDPTSLTETYRGNWNKWSIFYYHAADGEGVTVLGQVQDGVGYYVIATGHPDLTGNPPEDVMQTVGGFALSGEIVLPATVAEFESYVGDIVGLRPPALSIAIATTDDVIYTQGFGMADRPEGVQATAETVYFWGSITKTVTATAIMQLREQGLVDLNAPVSDYLDYFPAEHGITVWNLLTHSSGLPEPDSWLPKHLRLEGQPLPDFDAMDREYYEALEGLMFEPGTTSAYANPDFVTLGQIVEAVSGQ